MSKLVVIGFKKDRYRASEVLNELENMAQDWAVDLHDSVAVYRDYNGKLRMDQSLHLTTGEGALMGRPLGVDDRGNPRDSAYGRFKRSGGGGDHCGWCA